MMERPGRRQRWFFKKEGARGAGAGVATAGREEEARAGGGGGARLLCARCGREITRSDERIEVLGLHEHSQVNPHGYVWHFGCFRSAPGCVPTSPPSTEFSWFPGHAWQVASCRGCMRHLGWRFVGDGASFHGLILDRLVEREDENGSKS